MEKKNNNKKETFIISNPDDLKRLDKKLINNNRRLVISRVPKPTKRAFKEFSELEFEGDYGMTLKWCFDISMIYSTIILRLEKLEESMLEESNTSSRKEEHGIKTLGGTIIKNKKNE